MRNAVRILLAMAIVGLVVGGPFAYASYNLKQLRNFKVLAAGKVYRSGQASPRMLKKIIDDHGIRAVISLRDARPGSSTDQYDVEESAVRSMGLTYLKLSPKSWSSKDGNPPEVQANIDQFLKVMDDPKNYPVWIHCFAGTHRTGSYCALYRMEYERWTNDEATEELKNLGYVNLDNEPDVGGYLKAYVPRWKASVGQKP